MLQAHRQTVSYLLSDLDQQWESRGDNDACRLWITCSDEAMDGAVRQIQKTQNDLILRVRGAAAGQHATYITSISTALDHFPISEIVLCGHSSCSAITDDTSNQRERQSTDYLLQGVLARMARNDLARQLLARQMVSFRNDPRLVAAMEMGELLVTGMFYLEESGAFTIYHPDTGKFTAIGS